MKKTNIRKLFLYIPVILISGFFLSGCTKDSEVTDTSTDEQNTSDYSDGDVEVIGDIPEEVVQMIKDGWADTYTDVVIQEVGGMTLPNYYMVEVTEDGYSKIEPVDDRIKEIMKLIDKNDISYEYVVNLLGFTQESEVPGWERAYHLQIWVKYEGLSEYALNISELAAPEDHPLMLD
jgi:hypothetical protein